MSFLPIFDNFAYFDKKRTFLTKTQFLTKNAKNDENRTKFEKNFQKKKFCALARWKNAGNLQFFGAELFELFEKKFKKADFEKFRKIGPQNWVYSPAEKPSQTNAPKKNSGLFCAWNGQKKSSPIFRLRRTDFLKNRAKIKNKFKKFLKKKNKIRSGAIFALHTWPEEIKPFLSRFGNFVNKPSAFFEPFLSKKRPGKKFFPHNTARNLYSTPYVFFRLRPHV